VGCWLVCDSVQGKLSSSLPKSQNMTRGSITKEVSNLKTENANLQLKIRALEVAQARRAKEDNELQQYLHIEHTESVRADSDDEADQDDDGQTTAYSVPDARRKSQHPPKHPDFSPVLRPHRDAANQTEIRSCR
jgi:hypothetical protein